MRELREIRQDLDQVDGEMVRLFEKRMGLALEVAQYKAAHGLPVLDASREEQVLASRVAMLRSAAWTSQTRTLFQQLMTLSRAAQEDWLKEAGET